MLRKLYFILTPSGRRIARRIYYLPTDCLNSIFNKKDSLIPPKGKSFVGSGNFKEIGEKFFTHFAETTKIRNNSSVLDIGCGIGRIARPFAYFLTKDGKYNGFDIIDYGTNWCKKSYKKFPNFSFACYPLKNDLYNLIADKTADEFVFPYDKNDFDLVILISVFTHMQKTEVINYLNQIYSVLRPGGYCYATFFLTEENDNQSLFPYEFDNYSLHNLKVKNANVAYKKEFVLKSAQDIGYINFRTFEGWWKTGHKTDKVDFQDILILQKPAK
ncbi:MAG TPA: class I SAM-dependent methyltransferase [Bacteroidales bacterium]|nr:class I SAM-dependent methyltransferase [Bacteroidales bacterium]